MLLFGIVGGQLPQFAQFQRRLLDAGAVWREIGIVAGDQEAALSALGVLQCHIERARRPHHLEGVGHQRLALPQLGNQAGGIVGLDRHQQQRRDQDQRQPAAEAGQGGAVAFRSSRLAPKPAARRFRARLGGARQVGHASISLDPLGLATL